MECYEQGDTSNEQASNSTQEPATKYGDREIHASTSKPVIKDTLPESDDFIAETSDSFTVSEITDSVAFPGIPAISDVLSTETTDPVFFPVIPDSVSISEIADLPSLLNESFTPGNADSRSEITQKSYWNNWIDCVATLSCIGNYTNDCQTQVNDARNSDIPDIEQWIEEAKSTVIQIQENCERFIEKSETILQDIQQIKPKLKDPDPAQISENLVDHDLFVVRSVTTISESTWLKLGLLSRDYRVSQLTQIYLRASRIDFRHDGMV